MNTTKVSAYSLGMVLKQNVAGIKIVGYTVKPGFSNGLFMTSRQHKEGEYVGFAQDPLPKADTEDVSLPSPS